MRKIPFGFRFYLVCGASFLLAFLWVTISVPADDAPQSEYAVFSWSLEQLFYWLTGLAYFIILGQVLKSRIRKTAYILYLLAGGLIAAVALKKIYDVSALLFEGDSSFSAYRTLIFSFIVPVLIALLPPLITYWQEWFREQSWYRQFVEGMGGSSRWATVQTYSRRRAKLRQPLASFPQAADEGVTSPRIFLGRSALRHDPFSRLVGLNDDSHLVTIASTRSGKSICPIYVNACIYEGDMVFIDPKGEHTKTSFYRRCSREFLNSRGIECKGSKHFKHGEGYILDPCRITGEESSRYNPMAEIDMNDPNCREIIEAIADGCVLPESKENKHFEEMARSFLQGLIAYVMDRFPPENHNLPFVQKLMYGIDENGFADSDIFRELLLDMLTSSAAGGLPQQAASELENMGEKERGAVLSTLSRSLKWVGDPAMRNHLLHSDFKFSEIGTKTVQTEDGRTHKVIQTVYIVLPDTRMSELKRWMRTLTAVGTVAMRKRSPLPKLATLWIMDEFPLLGNIKTISDGYGLLAGYKVKFWIFLQNLGQLKDDYPGRWSSMIGNANTQIFGMTASDPETPKFVSEALGKNNKIRTERGKGFIGFFRRRIVSETPRELLTPSEVATVIGKESNKQIVFTANDGFPMLLERLSFKPLKIGVRWFKDIGLDGLRGHFKDW